MTMTKTTKKYDTKTETNAVAALKQLPQRPPEQLKSAREIIAGMSELIRARIASGYTYQQIAETLSQAGIKVTVGTLRAYLSTSSVTDKKHNRSKKAASVQRSNSSTDSKLSNASPKATVQSPAPARPPAFQDPDEK